MGRLVYSLSVSLDGFVETPSRSLDWVMVDEELHSFFNDQARELSASLYGRRMYVLCGIVSIGDVVKNRLEEMETETNVLREVYIGRK